MPLFGKKSPSAGSEKKSDKKETCSAASSGSPNKTPTVEDKYILKDVLGT